MECRDANPSSLDRRRLVATRSLGLGRALLYEIGRQEHLSSHLKELALPVFECGFDERPTGQVANVGHLRLVVFLVLALGTDQPVMLCRSKKAANNPNMVSERPLSRNRRRIQCPPICVDSRTLASDDLRLTSIRPDSCRCLQSGRQRLPPNVRITSVDKRAERVENKLRYQYFLSDACNGQTIWLTGSTPRATAATNALWSRSVWSA